LTLPSLSTAADEGARRLEGDTSQPLNFFGAMDDFEEVGDGWIRAEVEDSDGGPKVKARRTRDLVQALGRNRPDSTQGSDSDVNQKETGWELFSQPTGESRKLSKEASSARRKGSRHRSRKSHAGYRGLSTSSPTPPPPMPLPLSSVPPTQPFFTPYPIYTTPYAYGTSSFTPMQIPPPTHCFASNAAYAGAAFGAMTLYPPVIQLPPSASSMNLQGGFGGNGITGGTGIKHTHW